MSKTKQTECTGCHGNPADGGTSYNARINYLLLEKQTFYHVLPPTIADV